MNRMSPFDQATANLYQAMPGAPLPPIVDGFYQWGDVEGNDHWEFCRQIVATIVAIVEKAGQP